MRRIGKFHLSFPIFDRDWHQALPILNGVVVVRATSLYDRYSIEYVAFSDHFDEVPEGVEPPEYRAVCTREESGVITVKWEKSPI